jgi:thymidine phosphorylase
VRTEAVITAMEAPLGRAVGNALEVIECLDVLKGEGPADLVQVCVELTARMLVLGGMASDKADAERRVRGAIESGAGLDRFRRIIDHQGGDARVVDDYLRLPSAPGRHLVTASRRGYLVRLDAALVGRASVALGAGRDRVEDPVDPAVGILVRAKPGACVSAADPILEVHYRDRARLDAALRLLDRAIDIADAPAPAAPLIVAEVH